MTNLSITYVHPLKQNKQYLTPNSIQKTIEEGLRTHLDGKANDKSQVGEDNQTITQAKRDLIYKQKIRITTHANDIHDTKP